MSAAFPSFDGFFQALWGRSAFPWQRMLAERVAARGWPAVIDLPTASGKTACLDIAVYALAAEAEVALPDRKAPRRIWFVVDRRIVVDEAFARAGEVAARLAEAASGPLKEVADRLRGLSGTERPLAVARLRGGLMRDDGWARLPSQPAVITATVDQFGSRLLFRGYGHSLRTAPIFAGLAAHDSLVLLDEAHCAVPFAQTLAAVERYRGERWAESPIRTPFAAVVLSATPPQGFPGDQVFPGFARTEALDDPALRRRLETGKPAALVEVKSARTGDDPLVSQAVDRARAYLEAHRRVGVMVNRVRLAEEIADRLRAEVKDRADVALLTGRLRSYERDRLVARWSPVLRAREPEDPPRPVVLVSTQCLEVGADFSFDALVTQCASLDALRQRFGRLARMGRDVGVSAPATILARREDGDEEDPVYGRALGETWKWLRGIAERRDGEDIVDFGFEALAGRIGEVEDLSALLAPAEDAPVLLPAHLDLLCQTAPVAQPEPDVSRYLHGRPGPPEVQVVWRCDLSADDPGAWAETVALCPPGSGEMLSAPLWRVRAWLRAGAEGDESSDVEGADRAPEEEGGGSCRPALLWRGRDRSFVTRDPMEIAPGEVVVVPAEYGMEGLGQSAPAEALGEEELDLWEPARQAAGRTAAVRLNRAALRRWASCPAVGDLLAASEDPNWTREALLEAIDAVAQGRPEGEEASAAPPKWWLDLLREARGGRIEEHPAGGLVIFAPGTPDARRRIEPDLFADDDDLLSAVGRQVSLEDHSRSVERAARKLAGRCLPAELRACCETAARWHDLGKLDGRFQVLLHLGDEIAAAASPAPLAKSEAIPVSPARRRATREASGLPEGFRHEMLAAQILERLGLLDGREEARDLVLHLVSSHHGYARPFAPFCEDRVPPGVAGRLHDLEIRLEASVRAEWPAPHRVDSGLADRFWRLCRRYGWWGLSYLEAIVRLADWYGSVFTVGEDT